jgi:hypothetical protein
MYPYYRRVTALTGDDIAAIRELYAAAGNPELPTNPDPPPPDSPTNPDPPPPDPPSPPSPSPVSPTLVITSPSAAQAFTSREPAVRLAGSAEHPDGITEVKWINARGGAGQASGTRAWVVPKLPLQPGPNPLSVTAVASGGATASKTITVTYSAVTADTTAPSLVILSPGTTSVATSASTATITGRASDSSGVVKVTWTGSSAQTGAASGSSNWNTGPIPLRLGTNVITIRAYDAAGNVAWRSVAFTRR